MPLFLALLQDAASRDAELGNKALAGLRRYQAAAGATAGQERPVIAQQDGASLLDCGGSGRTVLLVPSLINPPSILDLDPDCSLADALATRHRVLLLDWGSAAERRDLDLDGHIDRLLCPLLERIGSVTSVGYCLGGTLALAAAARSKRVAAVVTLASPWKFGAYPQDARDTLVQLWRRSEPAAEQLGFLPMEVLQSAFWAIAPERIVAKFAAYASLPESSRQAARFEALEDWANSGEALPLPAARQLVEVLFGSQASGFGPLPDCPSLHFTASEDRIVPAETAAGGERIDCPAGHVGMIVGRNAPRLLHAPLLSWLEALHQRR